ncbi:transcriptional regulator, AraC family [Chitinophaga jiangningensis]|uniref:Transcriptional regulator, AraC family n=1 Tax=Chitinophaga jiangningensis TaxID=1419482 RepID=A0A1M6Z3U9_9BACT|nr:AraC family transcriptional regulator [Chitinophaga jiangningensis]SHL25168.1 transcriptional regulator, AraC family [Chitinophaga jiangningensis]
MGLIASLPEINKQRNAVFVMHEKSEKLIPLHTHNKGQLSYVEGGIAYITISNRTYVVPARHYFWVPQGMPHILRIGHSATVLRSLYFYAHDDDSNAFYSQLGIYPASELLIQMINYSERWDGRHVTSQDDNFEFLVAIKKLLPELNNKALPIILPTTDDGQMLGIIRYMEKNIGERLTLAGVSKHFNLSERSMSRLFQSSLQISFLQYLKTLRMVKAIEMILKTSKPVSDIAYEVGYTSISSFSDAFHEFTHSRPTDFRKS